MVHKNFWESQSYRLHLKAFFSVFGPVVMVQIAEILCYHVVSVECLYVFSLFQ